MRITTNQLVLCLSLYLLGGLAEAEPFNWEYQAHLSRNWPQKTIKHLVALLNSQHNDTRRVLILIELSDLYRVTRDEVNAKKQAHKAVELARQTKNPLILAKALNAYGNVLMNSEHFKDYQQVLKIYGEALKRLNPTQHPQLYANLLTNRAQLWIDLKQYGDKAQKNALYQDDDKLLLQQALKALDIALAATRQLPNHKQKAAALIHLSQIAKHIQQEIVKPIQQPLSPNNTQLTSKAYHALEEVRQQLTLKAYHALEEVRQQFDGNQLPRVVSYAYGYLGELYQAEGRYFEAKGRYSETARRRYSEAKQLTRQAIFYAQLVQATDILYLWERQLGQLLKALGDKEAAINAYQRAVVYLNDIRPRLATASYRSRQLPFRQTAAGSVYLELTELLLQKAKNTQNNTLRQSCLSQAQGIIEQFKEVELENYFHDDCVGKGKQRKDYQPHPCTANNHQPEDFNNAIGNTTAVLYPIIFPERVELLLHTPNTRVLVTKAIKKKDLEYQVDDLIIELNQQQPTFDQHEDLLPYAQTLYDWLIRPIESHLTQVKTLVIVPDGKLRTIPFAVLHDGNRYLIEKYMLATTPSLSLTNIGEKAQIQKTVFLVNALSEKVTWKKTEYEPLSHVPLEIEAISQFYQPDILLNKEFTKNEFSKKLKQKPYFIVHIATHGEFNRRVKKSFLLTYDGRLEMDDLEELAHWGVFRDSPVELLTLSACESAMSDDNAALGLSGIAVKAGTMSAVASLWQVNDLSTCYLMEAFYRHLKNQPQSKAKALQKAQLQLLEGTLNQEKSACGKAPIGIENYKHPGYWAAFLLIGNWL